MAQNCRHPMLVTAAIIENNGEFLITQRPHDKANGGRWEFPGGKVDFGEDLRDCIEREILEELGIMITADDLFEYSSHLYEDEDKHVVLVALHCTYESGDIKHHDIIDHKWVKPEDMYDYDITEADYPMVDKLIKEYS